MKCAHIITNSVLYFKITSAIVNVRPRQYYFGAWKVDWNYFKIISEDYCSSWIFSNMFDVAEI